MPEIAEVERARLRLHRQCLNHKITHVEVIHDTNIFKDVSPDEFAATILNKTVVGTKRWGKYFILMLDGDGPHIVGHLSLTGGLRFKHEELAKGMDWPPRFHKLLITFTHPETENKVEFGFKDPLRWARLRLIPGDPLVVPPISKLGFDPILNMPDFETFKKLVIRRAVPTKALLLDQSFAAGIGNWVADEILFQAKIHPAQYTNTLTDQEVSDMYHKMKYICDLAVSVEADESKFPEYWLMKHRWNKGKKNEVKGRLPNGLLLKFETVGGRTSAYAPDIQKLRASENPVSVKKVPKRKKKETDFKVFQDSETDEEEQKVIKKANNRKAKTKMTTSTTTRFKKENDALVEELEIKKELALLALGHYCLLGKGADRRKKIEPRQERVVIIGASSGIGKECALKYAGRGAKLVLFARRKELLDQLKQQCDSAGSPEVIVLAGDATKQIDLIQLAQLTRNAFDGCVDTVIHCAGAISVRPFMEACGIQVNQQQESSTKLSATEATQMNQVNDALHNITTLNYYSAVWTAAQFIPLLIPSKSPNLLIISSMAGKAGAPTRSLYAGSKHALHGFFDSLRTEVGVYNIHIGLICPGTVDTDLRHSAVDKSLGEGDVAGSKKNKLSAEAVANRIIQASDFRQREIYTPSWFGYAAIWGKLLAPGLIDYVAQRKYGAK
ncbi:Formamidopyrimidine-DNA glycosylase [Choanephora cucurbitarum]|uniref:Formamidopyrimidine-DNA glycosylase n=1 Tax=Choanephora cucurbitarum TaxID=101091 RepID=A0A1C7NDJ8_9FUNG|nr:Formamidopyrimidine-DNA glycosylase [Choanephora cucurbitarum]